jgi:hypothetical protein
VLAVSLGRLIRVKNFRGDPDTVVYVVAEPDPIRAVEILKAAGLSSDADFEDLGRVSDALLEVLELKPGQFRRT